MGHLMLYLIGMLPMFLWSYCTPDNIFPLKIRNIKWELSKVIQFILFCVLLPTHTPKVYVNTLSLSSSAVINQYSMTLGSMTLRKK